MVSLSDIPHTPFDKLRVSGGSYGLYATLSLPRGRGEGEVPSCPANV